MLSWKLTKRNNFECLKETLSLDFFPKDLSCIIIEYLFTYAQENVKRNDYFKVARLPLSVHPKTHAVTLTEMGPLVFVIHHAGRHAQRRLDILMLHPDAPERQSNYYSLNRYQLWGSFPPDHTRYINPSITDSMRRNPPPFPFYVIALDDLLQHLAVFLSMAVKMRWLRVTDYIPRFPFGI
jgi:hypothetical protein